MVTPILIVSVFVLLFAWQEHRARRREHRLRHALTEEAAKLREDRDAAIRAVRWVPMKDHELFLLAKTGCLVCHGAGVYQAPREMLVEGKKVEGKQKAVCQCVVKRMVNNAKYAFAGDGIPVRLATQEELDAILPHEKVEGADGEADVIPIGGVH